MQRRNRCEARRTARLCGKAWRRTSKSVQAQRFPSQLTPALGGETTGQTLTDRLGKRLGFTKNNTKGEKSCKSRVVSYPCSRRKYGVHLTLKTLNL